MDLKIKKLIAREGLILLGFLFVGGSIFLLGMAGFGPPLSGFDPTPTGNPLWDSGKPIGDATFTKNIGILLFCVGYPSYLLVRFVIWAIKSLREK